jgi:hypothetical protein
MKLITSLPYKPSKLRKLAFKARETYSPLYKYNREYALKLTLSEKGYHY